LAAPEAPSRLTVVKRVAETLAYGVAGGLALGLTGVPAGYLSGAILVATVAALAGRPLTLPVPFVQGIFLFLGTSLGSMVTPEMIKGIATYPLSIALLVVGVFLASIAVTIYLRVVHRWEKIDAYLASLPGAMSQVMALGAEMGADLRAIAIVQSARVVIIAIGLPLGMSLLGFVDPITRPVPAPMSLQTIYELAILLSACCVGAYVAHRVHFPGGLMFGAMITSAVLHGTGTIHAVLPWWVTNTAALALGSMIGARFTGTPMRLVVDYLGAAFGSFAVASVFTVIFAAITINVMHFRVPEVVISYMLGSVDAMMLLALALHLDPLYVGAHHIVRVMAVSFFGPLIGRKFMHKPKPSATSPQKPTTFQD
jgi:hypothetical protein